MGRKNKAAFRKSLHRERSFQLKSRLNKVKFTGITKTRRSTRSIYFCRRCHQVYEDEHDAREKKIRECTMKLDTLG